VALQLWVTGPLAEADKGKCYSSRAWGIGDP
jgi:hypothetical protein